MAVTKRPTHPAKASGCRAKELGRGKNKDSSENRMEGRIASPTADGDTAGEAADKAKPASVTGIAIAKPTSSPDTPMSRRARRFGIGSRMLMKAPSLPRGGTDGSKHVIDTVTKNRF